MKSMTMDDVEVVERLGALVEVFRMRESDFTGVFCASLARGIFHFLSKLACLLLFSVC